MWPGLRTFFFSTKNWETTSSGSHNIFQTSLKLFVFLSKVVQKMPFGKPLQGVSRIFFCIGGVLAEKFPLTLFLHQPQDS
jgi:hypothetical protein